MGFGEIRVKQFWVRRTPTVPKDEFGFVGYRIYLSCCMFLYLVRVFNYVNFKFYLKEVYVGTKIDFTHGYRH